HGARFRDPPGPGRSRRLLRRRRQTRATSVPPRRRPGGRVRWYKAPPCAGGRADLELYGRCGRRIRKRKVREILVGSSFDGKAKPAARMVPSLILRKYSLKFLFSDGRA